MVSKSSYEATSSSKAVSMESLHSCWMCCLC
jgi:hypothetical protein